MEKSKYNVREFINMINKMQMDVDVQVDGTNCYIAVCYGIGLTEEGKKYFADALDLPMVGYCIMSDRDEDYDLYDNEGKGRLANAEKLLYSMAGYCSCENYKKWFTEID